jgi:HEAT repeat protein
MRLVPTVRAVLLLGAAALPAPAPAFGADEAVAAELAVIAKNAKDAFEQDKRAAAIRRIGNLGGPDAVRALIPLFDDPFEHLADHCVSAWIAMLKGDMAAESQTTLVKEGLGHKDARVRAGAAIALGLTGGRELADAFGPAVAREQDAGVLVALARGARAARGGTLVPEAFVKHLAHADGAVVLAAAEAVAAAPDQAEAALRKALAHKQPLARAGAVLGLQQSGRFTSADLKAAYDDKACEVRIALAETLEARTPALPFPGAGEDVLSGLMTDPSWRVRAAAIEAAIRLWHPAVLRMLVRRLAEEEGRLKRDAHAALLTLTGADLAPDAGLWSSWWEQKGKDIDLGARPEPDRFGRIRRPGTTAVKVGGGQVETRTAAFFDLPLESERLMFVFDLSGSMGKAATKDDGGPTKLEATRKEFTRVLAALPATTHTDLVVYRYPSGFPPRPELTRALGKLQPLSPATRKKAEEWLALQPARGWGAFYEALVAAAGEEVDTIVLLSDGVPSRGRFERANRLVDEFVRANRFRRVAVDTVLVGERAADRELMEDLAWATVGRSTTARLGP